MRIAFYCQHVLGIGHFKRSMAMCKALVKRGHKLTLIIGGPSVDISEPGIDIFQLPGLMMDANFGSLIPCDNEATLDETKDLRQKLLFQWFSDNTPNLFITELYPLGRKGFRFELDPVLKAIKDGVFPPTFCCSSVRDILVEKKEGKERFEDRAVKTLNKYFHGLLIHSDPKVIELSETFGNFDKITTPTSYTGFIAPESPQKPKLPPNKSPLVIASIGGGNVGSELLQATVNAAKQAEGRYRLKIFCGKYSENALYKSLKKAESKYITVCKFTDNFPAELAKGDLSISMAGYNTCMNILQTGTPALFYPFAQNREQRLRVDKISRHSNVKLISEDDLVPDRLNQFIKEQLELGFSENDINLDGADDSCVIIEKWFKEFSQRG